MARAEGRDVRLAGDETDLECKGTAKEATGFACALIDALSTRAPAQRQLVVTLQPTAVVFHAPRDERFDVRPFVPRARRLGLDLATTPNDDGVAVTLSSTSVGDTRPSAPPRDVASGAKRTVH